MMVDGVGHTYYLPFADYGKSSDKIIHLQVIAGPKTRSHTMSGVKNSPASVRMFSSFRIFGWNEIEHTQHFEVYSRMLRLFRISFVVLVGQR